MKKTKLLFFLLIFISLGISSFSQSDKPDQPKTKDTGERNKVLIDFTQYEQKNSELGIYAKKKPR